VLHFVLQYCYHPAATIISITTTTAAAAAVIVVVVAVTAMMITTANRSVLSVTVRSRSQRAGFRHEPGRVRICRSFVNGACAATLIACLYLLLVFDEHA
jgi:hypothetical protein